jgi:hypothetical protein
MNFLGTSDHRRAGAHRSHLRMLRGGARTELAPERTAHDPQSQPIGETPSATEPQAQQERSRILIAGADPQRRAEVLADLTEALPADTQFGEAGAAWEVLDQASSSGVVMLAGDLDEVTAESLMHVLGHRHPSLPVVALGLFAESATRGNQLRRAASAAG